MYITVVKQVNILSIKTQNLQIIFKDLGVFFQTFLNVYLSAIL